MRATPEEWKGTPGVLAIQNQCPESHHFRIRANSQSVRVEPPTDVVLVGAKGTERVGVSLAASGLKSDGHPEKVVVECLDCKVEEGCPQGREEVPVEAMAASPARLTSGGVLVSSRTNSGLSTQSGAHDVGIIPQSSSGCPLGSEHLYISLDDEDQNNASSVSGWTGEISRYSTGTTFGFCRVNGDLFKGFNFADYAVLQLGTSCPAGSFGFRRDFYDEQNHNHSWASGNIAPNQSGPVTTMHFCFFPASGGANSMVTFPNFYVPYGVFAGTYSGWQATGMVAIDDEDDNPNLDATTISNSTFTLGITQIVYGTDNITGGRNSRVRVAKVANNNCNVNPCPSIGSYDGANCWVGQPPPGTSAFIWATNFYYTPVSGNHCPKPGSWFDGANCFVKAIPSNTQPFIWANMWYVEPICRP